MSEHVDNIPQYEDDSNNTGMAALAHILGLLTWVFGPLVLYLVAEDEFVKKNAAKAFTWQLFAFLYSLLSFFMISFFIGFLLLPMISFLNVVFCVVAAVKASDGKVWKYPGTIDLLESSEPEQPAKQPSERGRPKSQSQQDKISQKQTKARSEDELKQMYLDGEISDEEFEDQLDELQDDEEFDMSYN